MSGTRNLGFGDAIGQVFTNDYPTWSLGVTVSYPLGRSYEEASLARAEVEQRQAEQRISSLRIQAAETVRKAGRQIQSGSKRVDAARAGASLAQQRLDVEQRRCEVGLSTTFLVTQAQRDLLEAQVNLLQTMLDYESAIVNFEAVQQAPPLAAGDTVGVRGANIVPIPLSTPRGSSAPAQRPGSEVIAAALLSGVHMLTLALGVWGITERGRALARPLDDAGWKRLLSADNAWGLAALLWITSGLARVFYRRRGAGVLFAQCLLLDQAHAVCGRVRAGARVPW